jgi:hypothetical protein
MSRFLGHLAFPLIVIGLAFEPLGLAIDARIHSRNPDLINHESLVTLGNPGHLVMLAGFVILLAGVLAALLGGGLQWKATNLISDRLLPSALLAVVAVASAVYVVSVDDSNPAHVHLSPDQAIAADPQLLGLDRKDRALVGDSTHAHTAEVAFKAEDLPLLQSQIETARKFASRYADIKQAADDGFLEVTQDIPLIGAHFLNPRYINRSFDPARPQMLIYTYQDGAWKLMGLSWITGIFSSAGSPPPEGFAGPFDSWHYHENWCFNSTGAEVTSAATCKARQGFFVGRMGYMLHMWLDDNPGGLFSHVDPAIKGSPELYQTPALAAVMARFGIK